MPGVKDFFKNDLKQCFQLKPERKLESRRETLAKEVFPGEIWPPSDFVASSQL